MPRLDALGPYIDHDTIRVVVECVAGTSLKARYDPSSEQFVADRELPLGLAYPFDFGFVPGTRAEDGDPVDALVLHRGASFPGLVIPCRIIGMVVFRQREEHVAKPITNNRIVAVPVFHETMGDAVSDEVSERLRHELEHFFAAVTDFTEKTPVVSRWTGAGPAHTYLERVLLAGERPGAALAV